MLSQLLTPLTFLTLLTSLTTASPLISTPTATSSSTYPITTTIIPALEPNPTNDGLMRDGGIRIHPINPPTTTNRALAPNPTNDSLTLDGGIRIHPIDRLRRRAPEPSPRTLQRASMMLPSIVRVGVAAPEATQDVKSGDSSVG